MADVTAIEAAKEWSLRRLAAELGIDRDVIKRRIDDAGVLPIATRSGHPVYRLREAARAIYQEADGGVRPADELALAKAEDTRVQTEARRDRLREARGQLIQRPEVRRTFAALAQRVVQMMTILPDILERDVGLSPKQIVRAREVIDEQRTSIADDLTKSREREAEDAMVEDTDP